MDLVCFYLPSVRTSDRGAGETTTMYSILFVFLTIILQISQADKFVVIVAGSNGYQNYRHQADVCHAYHTVLNGGIPAINIITMIFDDVANNEGNPFPGKLFNTVNGTDVYHGCKLDYTGMNVNMDTFFKVLHGNKTSQVHRVLESTSTDQVFIVYTDHGAPGYVTFPAGVAMYAPDLNNALLKMNKLGKYQELLIYMDACNSGSMFGEGLLQAKNVLAVTAASKSEESYAAFCPPWDHVTIENNRETFSCLGDVFSINWIFDRISSDIKTVGEQITLISNQTANLHVLNRDHNSHVQVFGDMSIKSMLISSFQGNISLPVDKISASTSTSTSPLDVSNGISVSARDVPMIMAKYKVDRHIKGTDLHIQAQTVYDTLIEQQFQIDQRYQQISQTIGMQNVLIAITGAQLLNEKVMHCYKQMVPLSKQICEYDSDILIGEYAMQYHGVLLHACDYFYMQEKRKDVGVVVKQLVAVLTKICVVPEDLVLTNPPPKCKGGVCSALVHYPVSGTSHYAEFNVPNLPLEIANCYYIYYNIDWQPAGPPAVKNAMNQFVPQLMLGNALDSSSGAPNYKPIWNNHNTSWVFSAQYFFEIFNATSNKTEPHAVTGKIFKCQPNEILYTTYELSSDWVWTLTMGVKGSPERTSIVVVDQPFMGLLPSQTSSWSEAVYSKAWSNTCWELYGITEANQYPSNDMNYLINITTNSSNSIQWKNWSSTAQASCPGHPTVTTQTTNTSTTQTILWNVLH